MEPKGNDFATSNGIQSGRSLYYDGGNGDELHAGERQAYNRNNDGGFEDISREDMIDRSSCEVRGEGSENHGSTDLDPLVQSIYKLQSAKEALEKEVLKFREVGSLDGALQDLPSDFATINLELQLKEAANRKYTGPELEDFFRLKIEAEVEYLAISRTVQKLRVESVDQITLLREKTTLASEQAQMMNMLENTKNKASMLKKEADKLVNSCEDIACADEKMKLQMGICKYTSYFLVQLVMLVLILGFFIFHISPNYSWVVPT
ncbi:Hypothetical predicted protein [Olea europaea subsp. europaea]|uniref:Uncharacterized protein n=1 Tax=Olea europaea subsp. europaea TaxID=158383 RepID=A0A8S0RDH2_OLEEU|nr:Hypothetical predicted protein [Olea europaea subsp. europaea]